MRRYLIDIYRIDIPENAKGLPSDIAEATEDWLNRPQGRTKDYFCQLQGYSLASLADRLEQIDKPISQ